MMNCWSLPLPARGDLEKKMMPYAARVKNGTKM
jgi:hypothetical protein